uniref:NAD(P)-binding domain-containing protein n=1 Tax=Craspedostauros australis TaxID=1486917 RepID=A0A7S0F5L2_9STRA|mmetsp:Transcript_7016/g.19049  ORF Transcript_7016/g.19049 Transcript_7016/m.19049 type:complete len:385 (+) Transcript_7016:70-1224(+)
MTRRSTIGALFVIATAIIQGVCPSRAFIDKPPLSFHRQHGGMPQPSSTQLFVGEGDVQNDADNQTSKPVLVVGATGKVGQRVVKQLIAKDQPVLAMVRNETKAIELFGDSANQSPILELVVVDLGNYENHSEAIEDAISRCDSIISVSGSFRLSKLTDFLPWRLFNPDVSSWADRSHPYFANFKAQAFMIDLAKEHGAKRFVRLTGLSTSFSAFSFVPVIFSTLLSMTSRYHESCEQYLINSDVPYVILRPGGLADHDRSVETTWLQADPVGSCPSPGRVPRSDVAALAIEACVDGAIPKERSMTLGVRAVGEIKPKPQGVKEDGFPTARECIQNAASSALVLEQKQDAEDFVPKPYGVATALFVYSFLALTLKLFSMLVSWIL